MKRKVAHHYLLLYLQYNNRLDLKALNSVATQWAELLRETGSLKEKRHLIFFAHLKHSSSHSVILLSGSLPRECQNMRITCNWPHTLTDYKLKRLKEAGFLESRRPRKREMI